MHRPWQLPQHQTIRESCTSWSQTLRLSSLTGPLKNAFLKPIGEFKCLGHELLWTPCLEPFNKHCTSLHQTWCQEICFTVNGRVSGTKSGLVTSLYIYIYFNLAKMLKITLVLILRFMISVCVFWVLQLCLGVSYQFKGEKYRRN